MLAAHYLDDMPPRRSVRWMFVAALALTAAWGASSALRRSHVPGEVLAYTECSFRGPPRVVIRADLAAADTLPVRVHEEVHAEQCRSMGPLRYRLRNLTGSGKLSLEVPAYCAAALVRLKERGRADIVQERMVDDLVAAFDGLIDSAEIARVVRRDCPIMASRLARR